MAIVNEEIFGPVAALMNFETEDEAIRLPTTRRSGSPPISSAQNGSRAWRVAEKLEAGMVGVNEGIFSNEVVPFGGVKESGLGREGAAEGLDEYLETKFICLGGYRTRETLCAVARYIALEVANLKGLEGNMRAPGHENERAAFSWADPLGFEDALSEDERMLAESARRFCR